MPLTPTITTGIFLSNLLSNGLIGIHTPSLASAVANGLEIYATSGLQVTSIDAGTLGAGVGLGLGIIVPTPVFVSSLTASFIAAGIIGTSSPSLVAGLSSSFSMSLQQAIISTTNVGVGVGTGIVKLIPNPAVSFQSWTAGFTAAGLVGPDVVRMVTAISSGFDAAILAGFGQVVIAGPPSIAPGVGTGTGKLL